MKGLEDMAIWYGITIGVQILLACEFLMIEMERLVVSWMVGVGDGD